MTEIKHGAPERIYLQLGDEPITYQEAMKGEVSWCDDRVFEHDVEYVLASTVQAALEQPAQEPVAWIKDWADGSKELVPNKYDGSYPVYTHPAQPLSVARSIEQAHGIGVNDDNSI